MTTADEFSTSVRFAPIASLVDNSGVATTVLADVSTDAHQADLRHAQVETAQGGQRGVHGAYVGAVGALEEDTAGTGHAAHEASDVRGQSP